MTFDVPEEVVDRLKLRAVRDRRKLKDPAAALLRRGLAASPGVKMPLQVCIRRERKTGLPVIRCPGEVPRGALADRRRGLAGPHWHGFLRVISRPAAKVGWKDAIIGIA
jgi:plasmid stability protein